MRALFASVSLAVLALAAPASAQSPWSASGELTDADARDDDGRRYDEHRIRLEAGRRYRISVDSDAFDPVARLYRAGTDEPVAENDDGGGGLNSRIAYTPTDSGDYVLRVVAFSTEGRGAYAAAAAELPPLPPPVTAPGRQVPASGSWSLWQGVIAQSDPDRDGHHFDDYVIHLEAGQRRYVSLEGDNFDTLIQVMPLAQRDSDSPQLLDLDDDAGAGTNSFLVLEAAESGDYVVRVTSFGSGAGGPYRLWVSN